MKIYRKNSNIISFKFFISFASLVLITYLKPIIIYADTPNWKYLLENTYVTAFAEDGDFMWIAVAEKNIYKMNIKTLTIVDSTGDMESKFVRDMALDTKGNLWITAREVYKYDGKIISKYELKSNDITLFCSNIEIDKNDIAWIATNGGVGKYDGTEWIIYNSENSELPQYPELGTNITSLHIDKNNNVWAGIHSCGIAKYNGAEWILYNTKNSDLKIDFIQSIKSDKSENLLFAAYSQELIKFDGKNFTVLETKGLPDKLYLVGTFDFDISNNLYISNYQSNTVGLIKYDGINWTSYNIDNSELHSNIISDFIIDKNGNKWLALSGNNYGINIFNENGINLATGIETENKTTGLLISPNPVKDFIILDNGEYSGTNFKIYNINGIELMNGIIDGNNINVSNLKTGSYFLEIKDVKQNQKLKFIKE